MTIYKNPEAYAKEAFIPLEWAKIRCAEYLPVIEKMAQAKKCPKCGEQSLVIETGSYEEGTTDVVYCENDETCEFVSDVTEEFEPLHHWYDFDVLLAFGMDIERIGLEAFEKEFGSWIKFAEKQIIKPTEKSH